MGYRYLGNKFRLKDWIADAIAERVPLGGTVADPMCGTATVSRTLADRGFSVIASDQLRFPVLHAQARLLHDGSIDFQPAATSYVRCLEILNTLEPVRGFFWREYSDEGSPANGARPRKYLTGPNAARVDAIRARIKEWRAEGLGPAGAELLIHDLILGVNRVANIAGTYGYYRSTWNNGSLVPLELRPTPAVTGRFRHKVLHGRAEDVAAQIRADAFYIDPPYTKRQYAGNYHIPETLAQEDEPEPAGDGGLRDWSQEASDFCYRRRAAAAFKSILDNVQSKWVYISYSEDAHLPSHELLELLRSYGSVELREQPLERFRSNGRVARQGHVREHLYVLEMSNAGAVKSCRALDSEDNPEHALQH
jgi:adenine-specific DNA-methyltransferase